MRSVRWIRIVASGACVIAGLIAAAVTLSRLSGSEAYAPTLLVSFVPHVIPAYALVLAAALAAGRRLRSSAVAVGVPVLAAAGLVAHLLWVSPDLLPDETTASREGTPVRVLSINATRGQAEPGDLRRLIRRVDPDILVVTEVRAPLLGRLDALVPADLPRAAGSGYRLDTQIFTAYDSPGATELGLSLGGWRTDLDIGGAEVEVFGVHPFSPFNDSAAWREDHAALQAAVDTTSGPALIIGDLNATRDHPPLRRLADLGFRDAADLAGSGWQPTYPADGMLPSLLRIDHVLARGGWRVERTETYPLRGADHRALAVDLVLGS